MIEEAAVESMGTVSMYSADTGNEEHEETISELEACHSPHAEPYRRGKNL